MHIHVGADERALGLLLASGITGACDMGGDLEKLKATRRRIQSGELKGPRLTFAGPLLNGPDTNPGVDNWVIHTAAEAKSAVDSLSKLGVDFIKVHDGLSRESYLAIASEARAKRIPFAGHVPASITPAEASDSGQKSIEHLEFMPKPCMALFDPAPPRPLSPECQPAALNATFERFSANGTWLDPTIGSFRYFAPQQWPSIFAEFRTLAAQIRRSGVPILAGTDQSGFLETKGAAPGRSLHDELALLVAAGFSPAEALRAATLNPALFLGLDDLGTVEAGKTADLVLLKANPLNDIRNTERIVAVIAGGRLFTSHSSDSLRKLHIRKELRQVEFQSPTHPGIN
jgi:imidazolonepropionase-like amidohydrolase